MYAVLRLLPVCLPFQRSIFCSNLQLCKYMHALHAKVSRVTPSVQKKTQQF
jgi:hypothetical protein